MKWGYMLVVLMLLMTTGALAEEADLSKVSADDWTAQAADGIVTVRDGDGREIASLDYVKDEMAQDLLIAEDYNFDGQMDLAALSRIGTANGYFAVWLRQSDGGFERCAALDEICAPTPNQPLRWIESFERVSAAEYREAQYVWSEGELILHRRRDIAYQDVETVHVTDRMIVDGGEQITDRTLSMTQWETITATEAQAQLLAGALYGETEAAKDVVYEGQTEVDGATYYACAVRIGREMVCIIYLPEEGETPILMDDEMNGLIDPAWQIDQDGSKTVCVR